MDVHLLVYDLTGGLAKQLSRDILGFQLDAVYHTSIELRGREFVYDGGILEIAPGSSHLGRPMQRLLMGMTHLPMDIVRDYLSSIKSIFTAQAYDLFKHNCNNFSDTFCNFLLGKGIPDHITTMPQRVLESPMARMLLPQLTQGMHASRVNGPDGLGETAWPEEPPKLNSVHFPTRLLEFDQFLEKSRKVSTIIFFTSSTCPPCKALYPLYDQLAEHYGNNTAFIKVDINIAVDVAAKYEITATPTFLGLVRGEQVKRWMGADPNKLKNNVLLLGHMSATYHSHDALKLASFTDPATRPVLYERSPPLEKLFYKMGAFGLKPDVQALTGFVEARQKNEQNPHLPGLRSLGQCLRAAMDEMEPELIFTVVDLFRYGLVDHRMSAFYAQERDFDTILSLVAYVNKKGPKCVYSMRLVTLHTACNMFSTPLFPAALFGDEGLRREFTTMISSSFLDDSHSNTRVAASSLLFNVALFNRRRRKSNQQPRLSDDEEVELAASLLEAISQEQESSEALRGMLLSLGHLVYGMDLEGQLADLMRALDAKNTVLSKRKKFPGEKLIREVGWELLETGLRKP